MAPASAANGPASTASGSAPVASASLPAASAPQHQAVRHPRRRRRRDVLWRAPRSRLPPVVLLLPRPPPPLAAPRRRPSRQAQRQCRDRAGRDRACGPGCAGCSSQPGNAATNSPPGNPGPVPAPANAPAASAARRAAVRHRRGGRLAEHPAAEPECAARPTGCGGLPPVASAAPPPLPTTPPRAATDGGSGRGQRRGRLRRATPGAGAAGSECHHRRVRRPAPLTLPPGAADCPEGRRRTARQVGDRGHRLRRRDLQRSGRADRGAEPGPDARPGRGERAHRRRRAGGRGACRCRSRRSRRERARLVQ